MRQIPIIMSFGTKLNPNKKLLPAIDIGVFMNRILIYRISEKDSPCTVESFLKARGYSRQIIIQLKKNSDSIKANGRWAYIKTMLHTGDELMIFLEEPQSSERILPVPLPLSVVYEDEDILVVDKPADMPVHPSINNYDNTLANAVAYYYQSDKEPFVFRCINRLDRDTTGLLIVAKNALSASILSAQMKERQIHRTYLALCDGTLPSSQGTIDAPIARREGSAIERCVNFENGERAVTHYRVLETCSQVTLAELRLETGRTHQIRVHMQYLGAPLMGDYLYHPDFTRISRVALHSSALEFIHPITGKPMRFHVPLPEDMEKARQPA